MKFNYRSILFTAALVVLATACKFFFGPELAWSGFSPVMAIALFSGMLIKDKGRSFFLPLVALFLSDAAIQLLFVAGVFPYAGFYSYQLVNYALLLGCTLIGWAVKGNNYGRMALGGVFAPTLFFLLSNGTAWMLDSHQLYTNDAAGLMNSYVAGLPFYKNALIATLLFLPAISLMYNSIVRRTTAVTMA